MELNVEVTGMLILSKAKGMSEGGNGRWEEETLAHFVWEAFSLLSPLR